MGDGISDITMNIYEHGVAAEKDEGVGSLRLFSSTDLPIYSGFSLVSVRKMLRMGF